MSGMDVVSDQVLHIPQAPKGLQMAYSIHIHISWAQWTIVLRYIRPFWSFIHVPAPSQSGAFWTPRLTTKRIFIDTLNGVGPVYREIYHSSSPRHYRDKPYGFAGEPRCSSQSLLFRQTTSSADRIGGTVLSHLTCLPQAYHPGRC